MSQYQICIRHDYITDNKCLILDISGIAYHLYEDVISGAHDGLIKYLWTLNGDHGSTQLPSGVFKRNDSNRYFLPRSPVLFDAILQYYISGKIHTPYGVCQKSMEEELEFWKISQKFACKACTPQCLQNDCATAADEIQDHSNATWWQNVKKKMWLVFDNPKSSYGALVYAIVTSMFVFVSIVNLVVSSVPEFHLCPKDATEIYTPSETDKIADTLEMDLSKFNDTNNRNNTNMTALSFKPDGVLRFFSNCLGMQKFEIVEMLCICWFTVELSARFAVCPEKRKFIRSPVNIIDFLASFPFYAEVLLWVFGFSQTSVSYSLTLSFRSLRSITVLRVLKLGRYSRDLTVLAHTIREAKNELLTLLLFLTVETLIYGCIVFKLESEEPDTKYTSIPASVWWSVATVTTVGYGDIYPQTVVGRIVGSAACLTGIVFVAMPISALVEKFTKVYQRNRYR